MSHIESLYSDSIGLLTDLYQLTMSQGYYDNDLYNSKASFNLFFRNNPFGGGYTIAAGMETAIEYLMNLEFTKEDIFYLESLSNSVGDRLFGDDFLKYLSNFRFSGDAYMVREGEVVFPHEPLVSIEGSLTECQIVETALLNIINFQTLVATKSRRVVEAADGDPVLEFGMRRAQGIDGSVMASRAAYIGGCSGTSNVLAGKLFDIPVKGTHAHSWVMTFDSERDAFDTYASSMPDNCVFLVDTYDTIKGVETAIDISKKLRDKGHDILGIRLDSGDLCYLSNKSREMLDEAGFNDAKIVASNGLDEYTVKSLKEQGADIDIWGVGTKMATAYEQPALGGVYKMSAVKNEGEDWKPKMKLSERKLKTSIPGRLQTFRCIDDEHGAIGDVICSDIGGEYIMKDPNSEHVEIVDPMDPTRTRELDGKFISMLEPKVCDGEKVEHFDPSLDKIRNYSESELKKFHSSVKRFDKPHEYPVGLEKSLNDFRDEVIVDLRNKGRG